jgi:16S rRNA (cytidine1402-2'-O)-methyltransferase
VLKLNSYIGRNKKLGKLYVCGTPIGNLEDASIRLLKTLRMVDMIACEDTRHSIKLLNHFKIKNKLISYHEYSNPERENYIIEKLKMGSNVALISDAGMPVISDPGESLVRQAINAGIEVEVIPGPSACTAALAISGLDSGSFVFVGFLDSKAAKRRET